MPDNSWASKLFFAVEATDGTEVQIRSGDCNANIAFKAPATYATSQAVTATGAATNGTVNVVFTWAEIGTVATLSVTATSTVITPTETHIDYFILYATHQAFTYV